MTASTRKALRAFVKTVPHLPTHIVRAVGLAFWGSALAAACVLASHREISTGRPRFRNCLTSLLQSTIGFLGNGIGLLLIIQQVRLLGGRRFFTMRRVVKEGLAPIRVLFVGIISGVLLVVPRLLVVLVVAARLVVVGMVRVDANILLVVGVPW